MFKYLFKNKLFFIAGNHELVFCHDENKDEVLLGGSAQFLNDAKTNLSRQKISKENFLKIKIIEVDEVELNAHPKKYSFMVKKNIFLKPYPPELHVWRVTEVEQHQKPKNPFNDVLRDAVRVKRDEFDKHATEIFIPL